MSAVLKLLSMSFSSLLINSSKGLFGSIRPQSIKRFLPYFCRFSLYLRRWFHMWVCFVIACSSSLLVVPLETRLWHFLGINIFDGRFITLLFAHARRHVLSNLTHVFVKDQITIKQDKIFSRKRLSTGANFVHVYIEIWDMGILKFNQFSV